jgi:hypothetical protein
MLLTVEQAAERLGTGEPLADRLLNAAIDASSPPGKGKSPLERLTDHAC